MTTDQPALHQELEPPPFQVAPTRSSRLEHLHSIYADAKAKKDGATEDFQAVVDAIKAELNAAAPGQERIELIGTAGPPLRLTTVESWRVDSRKLKAEAPETYVRYAKKSLSQTLKVVAQGGEG